MILESKHVGAILNVLMKKFYMCISWCANLNNKLDICITYRSAKHTSR